jgi:hypothetical protein
VLTLYVTKGGSYVCHREDCTQWQGSRDSNEAKVCSTIDEVVEFFGQSQLAKQLYERAKINATQFID